MTPYNLRNCAYLKEFEKEKIVYNDISKKLTFAVCDEGICFKNTIYFITYSIYNRYLAGILNSNLIDWYYKKISAQLGKQAVRLFSIYVQNLPIPKIPESDQQPFVDLVNTILVKKERNEATQKEENEIDKLVYTLYGLTEEEIKIVESLDK